MATEWIKCDERLPDDMRWCLVWSDVDGPHIARRDLDEWATYDVVNLDDVTHWADFSPPH